MGLDLTSAILSISRNNAQGGDTIDADGFLVCGQCGGKKQCDINTPQGVHRVFCQCPCMAERFHAEREKALKIEFAQKVRRLRRSGLTDPSYRQTFANDDGTDDRTAMIAHRYVEEWPEMYKNGMGLLFYGGVGTGKTFWGCCIANALIDRGISAYVISMPMLLNKMQAMGFDADKNTFIVSLQKFGLLVIDDLGAERDTSFAMEQVYQIIDSRYRSKKPLICTTNLAPKDLKAPENIALHRSYDRVRERCAPVKVDGESRRRGKMYDNKAEMARILGVEL